MAAQLTLVPQDVISIINNEPRTTSLKVAEVFGKLHKNVLQKIESMDCSDEFASANFSAHVENQAVGTSRRDMKYYEMTKDGFMFLVMGFTGKQAARIKEAYINAFNWMASQLFGQPSAKTTVDSRTPLRDAVNMLVAKKKLLYPDAYAIVHQRFAVSSIEELTVDQVPQAVEYVHKLVLDGEWIPAQKELELKPDGYVLSERESSTLDGVFNMMDIMQEALKELEEPLRMLRAPIFPRVYDSWRESKLFLLDMKNLRKHCREKYLAMEKRVLRSE